jgi:hypothetical protein
VAKANDPRGPRKSPGLGVKGGRFKPQDCLRARGRDRADIIAYKQEANTAGQASRIHDAVSRRGSLKGKLIRMHRPAGQNGSPPRVCRIRIDDTSRETLQQFSRSVEFQLSGRRKIVIPVKDTACRSGQSPDMDLGEPPERSNDSRPSPLLSRQSFRRLAQDEVISAKSQMGAGCLAR